MSYAWLWLLLRALCIFAFHRTSRCQIQHRFLSPPHGNQQIAKEITNKISIWFNWNIVYFKEMDDSPRQPKEGGDCGVFVCLEMRYILLNRLFKTDIDRSTDVPQEPPRSYIDLVMLWTLKMTRFANIETSAHTNQNQTLPAKYQLPLTTAMWTALSIVAGTSTYFLSKFVTVRRSARISTHHCSPANERRHASPGNCSRPSPHEALSTASCKALYCTCSTVTS